MSFPSRLLASVLATSFYVFVRALASPESLSSPSSSPALLSASIPCVPRAGSYQYKICPLLQPRAFTVQFTRQSGLGTEKEFYAFRTSSSDDPNSCPENAFVCWNGELRTPLSPCPYPSRIRPRNIYLS
ncbi:hypothetical protein K435DRAFT_779851 [Dendrothele bispora CBS 962.96]|uniref:Autophagy-related protein 27 n=1 Tax=Dendrothele bispora (strain CBS 962.96) TaxID=1314807 RepID=A0A4S8LWB1_DENBC|nr:hypothetical protein K435DRAFT_779851 [Dendrothele bispora CBS 962.96]